MNIAEFVSHLRNLDVRLSAEGNDFASMLPRDVTHG